MKFWNRVFKERKEPSKLRRRLIGGAAAVAMVAATAPANASYQPGTMVAFVSAAQLRLVPTALCGVQFTNVFCLVGTVEGSIFTWNSSDSRTDDGLTIIKPTDQTGNGRWNAVGSSVLAGNAQPLLNPPTDFPPAVESISTDANATCLTITGYGSNATGVFHFGRARGTPSSPSAPNSGDTLMSQGIRAWQPGLGFIGSSAASLVILTENSVGAYSGCYWSWENTITGSNTRSERMRISGSGNVLIGLTVDNHNTNLVTQATISTNRAFAVYLLDGTSLTFYSASGSQTMSSGESAANSACYMRKDSTTSRSLNAAGTLNASGADMAEYKRKNKRCGHIAKGDVVGFDIEGKLTDKWAEAVSFGIKSTDPAYVGGDVWGPERPENPSLPDPPRHPDHPGSANILYRRLALAESVGAHELIVKHRAAIAALAAKTAQYEKTVKEHERAMERHRARAEAYKVARAAYPAKLAMWEAAHEAARSEMDRIAVAGTAPVNLKGAAVGDVILATARTDGSIGATAARRPTFEQYRDHAVGRVRAVLDDGRALVAILVT